MKNKRKVERKHLIYYLKVTDVGTNQAIGHVVNISDSGVLLISEKSIKAETNFKLQMFLPEEIQGSRYFEFDATSRWCQVDENPDFYNVGFEISDISPDGIQVIQRLIDKFCFK